ncbi:MAG: cytidine deaminase, partial [Bacteroidota bacterium]
MKELEIRIPIQVYDSIDQLSEEDQALLLLARKSLEKSHAPYSQFHVGAAVRLADGQMLGGANHENAAYPMCLCAERSVLAAAH